MNKKVLAAVCAILAGAFSVSAQGESCFGKDINIAQAGVGLLMRGPVGIAATYERGVHDLVSVGGTIGFSYWRDDVWLSSYYWSYVELPISVRAAFHPFNLPVLVDKVPMRDKLDVYGGMVMGFAPYFSSWHAPSGYNLYDESDFDSDNGKFLFSVLLGARYYFADRFAVFAEESAGSYGILNVGLSMKF